MKKFFLLTALLGAFSLSSVAQDDDMYFVPSKKSVERAHSHYGMPSSTYYSGSSRSVDDYNRRWGSSYEVLPADTGDIVSFSAVEGVYPDSLGDFAITQQMTRWEGYEPGSDYWAGYSRGLSDSYSWHSPWYYSSYYPWYDSWYYDPWYWNYGWYDPWYYGRWGWGGYYSSWYYRPYYYGHYGWGGGGYVTSHRTGTQNHGHINGASPRSYGYGRNSGFGGTRNSSGGMATRSGGYGGGNFGGSRSGGFGSTRSGGFGSTRSSGISTGSRTSGFGGARNTTTRTRSSSTPISTTNYGGSTFSGSNSGSGSSYSGGHSSGGGGSFGGGHSGGGGGSHSGGGGGGGFGGSRR